MKKVQGEFLFRTYLHTHFSFRDETTLQYHSHINTYTIRTTADTQVAYFTRTKTTCDMCKGFAAAWLCASPSTNCPDILAQGTLQHAPR